MSNAIATAVAHVRNKPICGHCYVTGTSLKLTRKEWREKFAKVTADGGSERRIGGDLTAFDAKGHIQFEMYD